MKIIVAVLACVALAGCSSSKRSSGPNPPPPTPSSYAPAIGADAALIASHIPSCTNLQSGSVGGSSMTSTASCTLSGHVVIIDGWASAADAQIADGMTPDETFYAYGGSWTAFLGDQGVDAEHTTLQMQLTGDAAGLLQRAVNHDDPPRASLDAQRTLAATIAKALGGTVAHIPAGA